jgi:hypothetical protein
VVENTLVEERVVDALAGSGLPMERLVEVAEELRVHLQQLIDAKLDAGLSETQAVEAALADFGPPHVIRKQLRRQQGQADRRHALAEVRRHLWWVLALSAFFVAMIAITSQRPGPADAASPFVKGFGLLSLFALMLVIMILPMYATSLLGCQVTRQWPRGEFHFARSFLRWMGIVAVGLASFIALLVVIVCAAVPFAWNWLRPEPLDSISWLLWHKFMVGWLEQAGRNFGLYAFGVIGFAAVIALWEVADHRGANGRTESAGRVPFQGGDT